MIYIYTCAYNAEKTLHTAVSSILNQTYTEFTYYILDNGSLDDTRKIVKEYANKDNRIIPLFGKSNRRGLTSKIVKDIISEDNMLKNSYFATLDADDEYEPDYLEKMIEFINKYDLDIAACGSVFIDAKTNKHIGNRNVDKNLIINGDGIDRYFSTYHQFMRTIWGKVYSLSVLRKCNFENIIKVSYGGDTIFAVEAFHNANRIGILSKLLHKYYVSPQSVSYKFDEKRIESDRIIFDATYEFLISKSGTVSNDNLNFLYMVYINAIKDTLNVLLNAHICVSDKLEYILDIFQSRHTHDLIKWSGLELQKKQLFSQVVSWVLSKDEARSDSGFDIATDIFASIEVYPTMINGWKAGEVFLLLTKIRDKQIEKGLLYRADSHIISVANNSPYLNGLDAGFLCYFSDIIFSILQNDEENALSQIIELIAEETEISGEYIESLLVLALNLSAKLELHDYFIYFKKLQISLLINLSKINEAIEEFADWDEVLSDDMDFKNLKERLGI